MQSACHVLYPMCAYRSLQRQRGVEAAFSTAAENGRSHPQSIADIIWCNLALNWIQLIDQMHRKGGRLRYSGDDGRATSKRRPIAVAAVSRTAKAVVVPAAAPSAAKPIGASARPA